MGLREAIDKYAGQHRAALHKHLGVCGLAEWGDLTQLNLGDFADYLQDSLAPQSARQYASTLSAILSRFKDEGVIACRDYASILKLQGERCTKTYLTTDELAAFERLTPKNDYERFVQNEFIVGTKTGCRHSDLERLTEENFSDGMLTYTSVKTGITASVPCSSATVERIKWLRTQPGLHLNTYNRILRRLCKRAGIDSPVKIHRGGVDKTGPKWKFISSHSARVSLATNLAILGTPTQDIRQILGHTNDIMTNKYIASHKVVLNDLSKQLFI